MDLDASAASPIQSYTQLECLFAGSQTEVCRVLRNGHPVIIKRIYQPRMNVRALAQLRHHYTVARALDHPAIVRPLALDRCENGYALVMADEGLVSLSAYWQPNRGLEAALAIALQVVDALDYLIQQRVIHKDIKPSNILIHPQTARVKLTDFSIASVLDKALPPAGSGKIEGTLAYLSPEQTGRVNRGVDYRTDFYSLGVTLFELLTGELPFSPARPTELLYSHIARQPNFPQQGRQIPEPLQALVLKLMAKDADARYQSAAGLRRDLQICQQQWRETQTIAPFPLAEQDAGDRFLIAEKVYGRQEAIATLVDGFERAKTRTPLMLVAGPSGIGKTAVIRALHGPVTGQQGYFIKGKFDQLNRSTPFLALSQAIQDLVAQLLCESDGALAQWRTILQKAVGESGQVLIDVVPALEQIIGAYPPAPPLLGIAAQHRFNGLFRRLIAAIATAEHPLVLVLDDLQWADVASLQLVKQLMTIDQHLLIVGAYRDNAVSATHPLLTTIADLKRAGRPVSTLTLSPLPFDAINRLVADSLGCSIWQSRRLTQLMERRTQGNPFFAIQYLKGLYEEGHIAFDPAQGHWTYDLMRADAPFASDMVSFMAQQLQKLPPQTQYLLGLAACVGNQVSLRALSAISQHSPAAVTAIVEIATGHGFLLPVGPAYDHPDASSPETYGFSHDQVQQAAYQLIPETERAATHLQVAQRLLAGSSVEVEAHLFDIANNICLGHSQIAPTHQPQVLAEVMARAARRAKRATAYAIATEYCQIGISILDASRASSSVWQGDRPLVQALHELGAEAAYLSGDFERSAALADQVIAHRSQLLDQIKSYEIKIRGHVDCNRSTEAIRTGLAVLSKLGTSFAAPSRLALIVALTKVRLLLRRRPILSLVDLPPIRDPQVQAKMGIIDVLLSATYISDQKLYPLLILKQMELILRYGNSPTAALTYCSYGVILGGALGDIPASVAFGDLAIAILERDGERPIDTGVRFTVHAFITPWHTHLRESTALLKKNHYKAVERGDHQHAAWSILTYLRNSRALGMNLRQNAEQYAIHLKRFAETQQRSAFNYAGVSYCFTLDLMGQTTDLQFDGQTMNREVIVAAMEKAADKTGLCAAYLYQLMLAYWLNDFDRALEFVARCEPYLDGILGFYETQLYWWFAALAWLATPSGPTTPPLKRVNQARQKLRRWASYAPDNVNHKLHLLEAERYRVLGQPWAAASQYDQAIAAAKQSGYSHEEALASERAAQFYLEQGKRQVAQGYLQNAYFGYVHWGATAKSDRLEQRYGDLLQPVLRQRHLDPLETLAAVAPIQSGAASIGGLTASLDLAAVLKASQILSRTIQLDGLLHQLTQIVLKTSGGDRCTLLLPAVDGVWQVRAVGNPEGTALRSDGVEGHPDLPAKLIHYVKHTQIVVVADDLNTDLPIVDDKLRQQHPKSLLCLPILNQGRLLGLLYLTNQQTQGVFTRDRILVLNFLCSQAAISLENARLYQQAQAYAQQLQDNELQTVQNEKTLALGNLVAGVAHELNNPIGFVSGNLSELKHSLAATFEHLQLYRTQASAAQLQEHEQDIELDYLLTDIPKMLDSMERGCDRIRAISTSLRIFSRRDNECKIEADIHEGIDSTLLLLKYRLKLKDFRPDIEVVRCYGDLPEVNCFPGQLNQVFMNILANAIDMFDAAAHGQTPAQLRDHPQRITITTRCDASQPASPQIEVCIHDNGSGMDEAVCAKIFDRDFTTKAVGEGTGLGLAIARQIVVERHGGSLLVQSQAGKGTTFTIRLPA